MSDVAEDVSEAERIHRAFGAKTLREAADFLRRGANIGRFEAPGILPPPSDVGIRGEVHAQWCEALAEKFAEGGVEGMVYTQDSDRRARGWTAPELSIVARPTTTSR